MSVDASHMQSPATVQNSVTQGSVAPPPVTQAYDQVPGSGQPQQVSQPGTQQEQPVAPVQNTGPSVEDIQRQLEAERNQRLQRDQELAQMRGVVGQIQTAAEEQQRQQQFNQRMNTVLAAAENMPTAEANRYISQQTQLILNEQQNAIRQQSRQQIQQAQQAAQQAALPQYAEHLASSLGLSESGKRKLNALGDPELMYKMAPIFKADEDDMNSKLAQFQQNQVQQGRAQEVAAMQNAGLGAIGGQNTGSFQVEIPDDLDPDEKALRILNYQKHGPNWQPRQ